MFRPFCIALSLALAYRCSDAAIDADKAAELSRWIREHFRSSGANWISPKMLQEEINLRRNTKPLMFVFTSRSCADCRAFMDTWYDFDKVALSSLTAQFLAVLAVDDYAIEMSKYSPPEADYLPRVLFADPDGTLRPDFKNAEAEKTAPYYYENADQVVDTMQRFLQQHLENQGTDVFPGDLQEDIP